MIYAGKATARCTLSTPVHGFHLQTLPKRSQRPREATGVAVTQSSSKQAAPILSMSWLPQAAVVQQLAVLGVGTGQRNKYIVDKSSNNKHFWNLAELKHITEDWILLGTARFAVLHPRCSLGILNWWKNVSRSNTKRQSIHPYGHPLCAWAGSSQSWLYAVVRKIVLWRRKSLSFWISSTSTSLFSSGFSSKCC